MIKKKKNSFKGKTRKNADSRKKSSGFGHLLLPEGVELFVPEMDTKVDMDIMPYLVSDKRHPDKDEENEIATPGTYWYKRPFKTHRGVGANNETVVCPTTFGKKCPICEYRDKLRKEGADDEEIKVTKTSERNLYAVFIKNNKSNKSNKLFLLDTSDYLFQETFEEQLKDYDEFETFPDHQSGSTLRVTFAEDSFGGNKYAKPTRFDFVKRKEQYDDEILEQIPDLDKCFKILSYDDLKAKFLETTNDEDDEDQDDDEIKPSKSKKTSGKKVVEEDEDEDEDQDEDELEDEDDEDEDEDEPNDEDEDEDEPPARKRKVTSTKKIAPKTLVCKFGHKFGVSTDKFDDCEDCKIWHDCISAKKANKK